MIKKILQKIGIDDAIFYVLLGKVSSILSGLAIILLIPYFMSEQVQGYYYTFSSVVALQIIFELGLSTVITQFASHEMVGLKYDIGSHSLSGEEKNRQRYLSLVRLSIKWYCAVSLLIVCLIGPLGLKFFLSEANQGVDWISAWGVLVIATALNLLFISITSIAEGSGLVAHVNKMRAIQSLITATFAVVFIVSGIGLYATAASALSGCIVFFAFSRKYFKNIIKDALLSGRDKNNNVHRISWVKEILPMQWRIALSWMAGYFIFFTMTPISFKFLGAVYAGKLGMSLTLCNMIMATGLAWISTKYARWGGYIAGGKRNELNHSYKTSLIQSTLFIGICLIGALICLIIFGHLGLKFTQRFFEPSQFCFLALAIIGNHIVACMATYIRVHKTEKMTWASVVMAILTTTGMLIIAYFKLESFYIISYCILIWVYFVPQSFYIYIKFKENYEKQFIADNSNSNL